ncbi:hypothetical protein D3C87_1497800 [compost metagenome]
MRLKNTGVKQPRDVGRMGRFGLVGVVGLVIVGAIEKQADVQGARAGGGTAKPALGI